DGDGRVDVQLVLLEDRAFFRRLAAVDRVSNDRAGRDRRGGKEEFVRRYPRAAAGGGTGAPRQRCVGDLNGRGAQARSCVVSIEVSVADLPEGVLAPAPQRAVAGNGQ